MQALKAYVYESYFKKKPLIDRALQETAVNICNPKKSEQLQRTKKFFQQDFEILLPLLLKKVPFRKHKINIAMRYIASSSFDCKMFSDAIEDLCKNEASFGEKVSDIMNDRYTEKSTKIKNLNEDALSAFKENEPLKQGLFFLLWQHDVRDLVGAYDTLKKENLDENVDAPNIPALFVHLNVHLNGVIHKFVKNGDSINVAYEYFSCDDQALSDYFALFLWKNFEKKLFVQDQETDKDYFKKFDQFLIGLRKSDDVAQADQYKKILDEQATLAIADTITSKPVLPQVSYFDDTENLKSHKELEDKVYALNTSIYDVNQRQENINILQEVFGFMQKIVAEGSKAADVLRATEELSTTESAESTVISIKFELSRRCFSKINYFDSILNLWQDLDANMSIKPRQFTTVIACLWLYIPYLNDADADKIKELIKYKKFADFIASGFDQLQGLEKITFVASYQNLRKKIGSLPELGDQVKLSLQRQSPVGQVMSEQPSKNPLFVEPGGSLSPEIWRF